MIPTIVRLTQKPIVPGNISNVKIGVTHQLSKNTITIVAISIEAATKLPKKYMQESKSADKNLRPFVNVKGVKIVSANRRLAHI